MKGPNMVINHGQEEGSSTVTLGQKVHRRPVKDFACLFLLLKKIKNDN